MSRPIGVVLTLVLVLAALGVAAAAVYNATHGGDAHLTASLGGAAATLITSVSLLWAPRPGGLDAMARGAERDFAVSPPRDPRAALDILDLSRTVSSLGSPAPVTPSSAPVVAVVSGPHSAPTAAAPASPAGSATNPAATTNALPALLPFGLVLLLLGACSPAVVHQRRLGALHTQAAGVCKTQHLTCAALAPCSTAVRSSLADWQAVSVAASKGDDAGEVAALVVAGTSEIAARAVCKTQGVK
jgi:hypothetical protein